MLEYKKDIKAANLFFEAFGYEFLKELSISTQEFFHKNIDFIQRDAKKDASTSKNDATFYCPADFDEKNIIFVDNALQFIEMLNYFETKKPDVVGKLTIN